MPMQASDGALQKAKNRGDEALLKPKHGYQGGFLIFRVRFRKSDAVSHAP